MRHIEQRWAYALGFGLPITLASWWSSDPVVNLALFALLYPLFALTSTSAIPQPLDPALPGAGGGASSAAGGAPSFLRGASGFGHGSFSIAAAEGGEEHRGRKGAKGIPTRIRVLVVAELAYAALAAAFGLGAGGAGGARKKDAAMGHGHGASPARMAMAQRVNSFDPNYGAPPPSNGGGSAYAGSAYGAGGGGGGGGGGSAYGSPVRARPGAAERYSMESDPYATQAPYAGSGAGGAQATPPRRGYASEYASPAGGATPGSAYGGAGPYGMAPPPQQPAFVQQPGGGAPIQQGGGGYGADKTLDSFIRQAGMRGKNKGD